ncbi:MAG: hypothetical protein JST16_11300 [Bdellovibrionales bacterium]|nr:hypothetical protein [Bdellovibrionales bacterium]
MVSTRTRILFTGFTFLTLGVRAETIWPAWVARQSPKVQAYLKTLPVEVLADELPTREGLHNLYSKVVIPPDGFEYNARHVQTVVNFAERYLNQPGDYYFLGNGMVYTKHVLGEILSADPAAQNRLHILPFSRDLMGDQNAEEKFRAYLRSEGVVERAANGRIFLIDSSAIGSSLRYVQSALLAELKSRGLNESEAMNRVVPVAINERNPEVNLVGYNETADYLHDHNKAFANQTISKSQSTHQGRDKVISSVQTPMIVTNDFGTQHLEMDYFAARWTGPLSWKDSKYSRFSVNGRPVSAGGASEFFSKARDLDETKKYIFMRLAILQNLRRTEEAVEAYSRTHSQFGNQLASLYRQMGLQELRPQDYFGYEKGQHQIGETARQRFRSQIKDLETQPIIQQIALLKHPGLNSQPEEAERIYGLIHDEIVRDFREYKYQRESEGTALMRTLGEHRTPATERWLGQIWHDLSDVHAQSHIHSLMGNALGGKEWINAPLRLQIARDLLKLPGAEAGADRFIDESFFGKTPGEAAIALKGLADCSWCQKSYSRWRRMAEYFVSQHLSRVPQTEEMAAAMQKIAKLPYNYNDGNFVLTNAANQLQNAVRLNSIACTKPMHALFPAD